MEATSCVPWLRLPVKGKPSLPWIVIFTVPELAVGLSERAAALALTSLSPARFFIVAVSSIVVVAVPAAVQECEMGTQT